jgi:cell division protein FtsN
MDYKNRIPGYRPPRPAPKKKRTGLWLALAGVVAIVIGGIGWVLTHRPEAPTTAIPAPLPTASSDGALTTPKNPPPVETKIPGKKNGKVEAKDIKPLPDAKLAPAGPSLKPVQPRFSFYKILPEKEAIVPENEIKNLKRDESLGKQPSSAQYLLQVGSFTNPQEAEKLKAKLSTLKIKSHIETVKIESAIWNRVKIGPFTSLAAADGVRSILRGSQIDSVVQKAVNNPPAAKPAAR